MSYKDLIAWQKAISLCPKVYALLRTFPSEEQFAMSAQIRRAVVSIPANIAEGQARQHDKETIQFLSIARGSLAELDTLLIISQELKFISYSQYKHIEDEITEIGKLLNGLIRSLKSRT